MLGMIQFWIIDTIYTKTKIYIKGDKIIMAESKRLFNLKETKGSFQLRGKVTGVKKGDKFFKETRTKNNNKMRVVNFGVKVSPHETIYVNLVGMEREFVTFTKRKDDDTFESKKVSWERRNKFKEPDFNLIGIKCGLKQEEYVDEKDGKTKVRNISINLAEYDACEYLHQYLKDDMDVFISGKMEYSSYTNKNGEIQRKVNLTPTQVSLCLSPIDFESNEKTSFFKQRIVFMGIEDDEEMEQSTVEAMIVNYNSIERANFIVRDPKKIKLLHKSVKPYTAITVEGEIVQTSNIVAVEVDNDGFDDEGSSKFSNSVRGRSKIEYIITKVFGNDVDEDSYNEDFIDEAMKAIRKAKEAKENFGDFDDEDDEDLPF